MKRFELSTITINGISKKVFINLDEANAIMYGTFGMYRFIWKYTQFCYPTVQTTNNKKETEKYARLYILEKLALDNYSLDTVHKDKNEEYYHLDNINGVWCNVFKNGYIRGEVDNVPFAWQATKYELAIACNVAGFNGCITDKIDTNRIIDRLKTAGYNNVNSAFDVFYGGKKTVSNDVKTQVQNILNAKQPINDAPKTSPILNRYIYLSDSSDAYVVKAYIDRVEWMIDNATKSWVYGSDRKGLVKMVVDVIKACGFSTPNMLISYATPILNSKNYLKYQKLYNELWKLNMDYSLIEGSAFSDGSVLEFLDNVSSVCPVELLKKLCELAGVSSEKYIKAKQPIVNVEKTVIEDNNTNASDDNYDYIVDWFDEALGFVGTFHDILDFIYMEFAPNYYFGKKLFTYTPECDLLNATNDSDYVGDWTNKPNSYFYKKMEIYFEEEGFSESIISLSLHNKSDMEKLVKLVYDIDENLVKSKYFTFCFGDNKFYSIIDSIKYCLEVNKATGTTPSLKIITSDGTSGDDDPQKVPSSDDQLVKSDSIADVVDDSVVNVNQENTDVPAATSDGYIYLSDVGDRYLIKAYADRIESTVNGKTSTWKYDANYAPTVPVTKAMKNCGFLEKDDLIDYVTSIAKCDNYSKYQSLYDELWRAKLDYTLLEESNFSDDTVRNIILNYAEIAVVNDDEDLDLSYCRKLYSIAGISDSSIDDILQYDCDCKKTAF